MGKMGGMTFLRRVELWKNGRNGQSGQMGEMGASRAHFEEFTEVFLIRQSILDMPYTELSSSFMIIPVGASSSFKVNLFKIVRFFHADEQKRSYL